MMLTNEEEALFQKLCEEAKNKAKLDPHPELQEGEIFLMNVNEDEFKQWVNNSPNSSLTDLRLGEKAYQTGGLVPVPAELNYRPMFGKRK